MGTHTAQEQMGRPQEMSQERFQRGADPADESQEVRVHSQNPDTLCLTQSLYHLLPQVDMRMILEALKRDMQAAMEGEEATSNTEKEEEEPRSTSDHLKELSPYSLYK